VFPLIDFTAPTFLTAAVAFVCVPSAGWGRSCAWIEAEVNKALASAQSTSRSMQLFADFLSLVPNQNSP
jgi:hypothetical protein